MSLGGEVRQLLWKGFRGDHKEVEVDFGLQEEPQADLTAVAFCPKEFNELPCC
jgi:hypothetical protein